LTTCAIGPCSTCRLHDDPDSSVSPEVPPPDSGSGSKVLRCPIGKDRLLSVVLEEEMLVQCFFPEPDACVHAMSYGHARFCRNLWKFDAGKP
jgi:hypothetical protein